MEITQVSEEDLKRLAEEQGPRSAAATVLRNLTKKRAKDRQVFAWQFGQYYFVDRLPMPRWKRGSGTLPKTT